MDSTVTTDVVAAYRRATDALTATLAGLDETDWEQPTPAPGWSVRDQVAHLAFVFDLAALACLDPQTFADKVRSVADVGFDAAVQQGVVQYGRGGPADVLARFTTAAARAAQALADARADTVPWLSNPLPPAVLTMAGLLETFAHAQDIHDALGTCPVATDDLAYLVQFVSRTRDFGYLGRGLEPPAEAFRFEVELPSGRHLSVGPDGARQVVRGPALDLVLLAARRRHVTDLRLETTGDAAAAWLPIAQAYRGPGGAGRRAGQFSVPV